MKHKHCELIKAWADGAEIEFYSKHFKRWVIADRNAIHWHPDYEYRLFKPEPKPDVVEFLNRLNAKPMSLVYWEQGEYQVSHHCIKVTFDGETGELKSAEVLK